MICSPTGRPSRVKPAGTLAAGWPVRLASAENGVQPDGDGMPRDQGRPVDVERKGRMAAVGVSNRS